MKALSSLCCCLLLLVKLSAAFCPHGWFEWGSVGRNTTSCYFVSPGPMNWHLARRYCDNMGGGLAEIDSEKEQVTKSQLLYYYTTTTTTTTTSTSTRPYLIQYPSILLFQLHLSTTLTTDRMYWLGLSDLEREGHFVRVSDGASPGHASWHAGEPNDNGGEEDCAHMYKEGLRWNDADCQADYWAGGDLFFHALCEINPRH